MNKSQEVKAYSVKSAAIQLDVSEAFIRKLIRIGNLKAKKFGAKTQILDSALSEYIELSRDWKPINKENEGEHK